MYFKTTWMHAEIVSLTLSSYTSLVKNTHNHLNNCYICRRIDSTYPQNLRPILFVGGLLGTLEQPPVKIIKQSQLSDYAYPLVTNVIHIVIGSEEKERE